jgi:ABC-type multidrug transport system fused ATPase/permease subunit
MSTGRKSIQLGFLAIALGGAAAVVYGSTLQNMPLNDGYLYMERLDLGNLRYSHILYLPFVAALRAVLSPFMALDSEHALLVASAVCASAAVAVVCLSAARVATGGVAVATALMFMFLPGTWFHATTTGIYAFHGLIAAVAGLALLRCTDPRPVGPATAAATSVALAAVPLSHLSGVAVVLPAIGGAVLLRKSRIAAMAIAGSLVLFAIVYFLTKVGVPASGAYEGSILSHYYQKRLAEIHVLPAYVQHAFEELLLYSAPASPLAVAGLRILWRTRRPAAVMILLWILGYLGVCTLIGDRFYGSYYISTFAAQAVAAAPAVAHFATGGLRMTMAAALALAPALATEVSGGTGLAVFLVSAAALWVFAAPDPRPAARRRAGWAFLPAATALVFCIFTIVPRVILLPNPWAALDTAVKTRVQRTIDAAPEESGFLVIESEPFEASYWNDTLSRKRPDRFFCVMSLDIVTPGSQDGYMNSALEGIERKLRDGDPVWVVGDASRFPPASHARRFMQILDSKYQFDAPQPGQAPPFPVPVRRVARKP